MIPLQEAVCKGTREDGCGIFLRGVRHPGLLDTESVEKKRQFRHGPLLAFMTIRSADAAQRGWVTLRSWFLATVKPFRFGFMVNPADLTLHSLFPGSSKQDSPCPPSLGNEFAACRTRDEAREKGAAQKSRHNASFRCPAIVAFQETLFHGIATDFSGIRYDFRAVSGVWRERNEFARRAKLATSLPGDDERADAGQLLCRDELECFQLVATGVTAFQGDGLGVPRRLASPRGWLASDEARLAAGRGLEVESSGRGGVAKRGSTPAHCGLLTGPADRGGSHRRYAKQSSRTAIGCHRQIPHRACELAHQKRCNALKNGSATLSLELLEKRCRARMRAQVLVTDAT